MALSGSYRIPRGTRAALNTLAGAAGLKQGQLYLITDEDRLAVGTSTTTYAAYAKQVNTDPSALILHVDGGGVAIAAGAKLCCQVPFAATITRWTIATDQAGSIQFDLWRDTYANAPPTVADTITGSAKPLVSAAQKATSATLTGWSTTLAANDMLMVNVDSAATILWATLTLQIQRI